MNERVKYLIDLLMKLKIEEFPTEQYKLYGATLAAICAIDGPAYHRVKNWLESKMGEKIQKDLKGELDIKSDVEKLHKILKSCFELAQERMPRYGNSWRSMDIRSLARLMIMKLDRISELGEDDAKTFDELSDCLVYCAFGLILYNEKNNK